LNIRLKREFELLEKETQDLLNKLNALRAVEWNNVSGIERWSIGQILTHLLTAEILSLNYMKKKSLGVEKLKNSGWVESIKILLLKISQRLPIKYKAPAHVIANTLQALSFNELKEQWRMAREDLKKFLEGIDDRNIRKKIYKHPVVGYLDVVQAIMFTREHFHHHLPQIRKIAASHEQ
jgi:hypothetical protein